MKRILVILLTLCQMSFAVQSKKITATGGAPIPTGYATSLPSLAVSSIPSIYTHVLVYNETGGRIAFTVDGPSPAVAPANDFKDVYLPPGMGYAMDGPSIFHQIYLRSDTGSTITSGNVYIHAW